MNVFRCLTRAAVVLACCGLIMPQAAFAAPPAKASNDVALAANGTLTGVLLTKEGKPLDGAVVSVRRGGKEMGTAVSTTRGNFAVAGLSSGVYDVVVGEKVIPVRAWTAEVAPPNARAEALIVVGHVARGQEMMGMDIITLWTLTASTGALILAAINQADLNDIKDDLKSP